MKKMKITLLIGMLLWSIGITAQSKEELKALTMEKLVKKELKDLSFNSTLLTMNSKRTSAAFIGYSIMRVTPFPVMATEEVSVRIAGVSAQFENKGKWRFLSRNSF